MKLTIQSKTNAQTIVDLFNAIITGECAKRSLNARDADAVVVGRVAACEDPQFGAGLVYIGERGKAQADLDG